MALKKNILVVGGGLAGTFVAVAATARGHHVTLADAFVPKAASRVAAGLFNVMTGREASKTWLADELLAAFNAFLDQPRFAHLRAFVHFMPIYRPYLSGQQYNDWMARLQDPAFGYLAQHVGLSQRPEVVHNPLGGLRVTACGWVEVEALCVGVQATLSGLGMLRHVAGGFDYSWLDPSAGRVSGADCEDVYDEVIFAEGLGVAANPWFDFVALRPLKGQVIEVRMAPGLGEEEILLRKGFLIPKGNNIYTAGSTYETRFLDDEPTTEGIETLAGLVKEQVSLSFETLSARAALRPTTPNRRPVLGRHPDFPRLAILNGLGTKGVLQAPYMAELHRAWLDGDVEALPAEVDVRRFLKKIP